MSKCVRLLFTSLLLCHFLRTLFIAPEFAYAQIHIWGAEGAITAVAVPRYSTISSDTTQQISPTSIEHTVVKNNTPKEFRSEQVTITGSRIPDDGKLPRYTLVTLQRSDIEHSPARSVEELLRNVAGIDVRQRGFMGVQADISIRGGTFEQTLVLVDGIKMLDPQTGHHAMNIPLTLDDIERVEIVKGPVSHQFGPNAMNGAINIITRKHMRPFARLQGMVGDFGLWEASFSGSLPLKLSETTTLRNRFSFLRRRSDGYRNRQGWTSEPLRISSADTINNTDFDITTLSGTFELFSTEKTSVEVLASWTGKQFGANGFYVLNRFPTQYEETTTSLVSVVGNFNVGLPVRVIASWRRNQDYFLLRRENPAFYRNLHTSNTVSLEAQTQFTFQRSTFVLGLEGASDILESNNLGYRNRARISAFGEIRTQFADNITTGGAGTILYNSDWGINAATNINVGWQITSSFAVHLTSGRSFRVPSYTDLYYLDAVTQGNPHLKPERSETFEIGATWREGIADVRGTLFYRFSDNLIDYTRNSTTAIWRATNLSSATTSGADIHFTLAMRDVVSILERVTGSYTVLNPVFTTEPGFESRYALDQLHYQANLIMDFRAFDYLRAQVRFRYEQRYNFPQSNFSTDARLGWNGYGVEVFAEATNVFNVLVYDFIGVPAPGRWIRFGVAVNAAEFFQ